MNLLQDSQNTHVHRTMVLVLRRLSLVPFWSIAQDSAHV